MAQDTDTAPEQDTNPPPEVVEGATLVDKIVLGLCAIGVIVAFAIVLDASDIRLFDGHAADVLSGAWNRTATIGLIVALVVAALVGVFVYFLARSTIGSDRDDAETGE